jgi:hypothetical protein
MICFCGCRDPAVHLHHAIYRQELTKVYRTARREGRATRPLAVILADERNLLPAGHTCHLSHHAASQRYRLDMLPDSVYVFASEVLGIRAHAYLSRFYAGEDARLDALEPIEAVV